MQMSLTHLIRALWPETASMARQAATAAMVVTRTASPEEYPLGRSSRLRYRPVSGGE